MTDEPKFPPIPNPLDLADIAALRTEPADLSNDPRFQLLKSLHGDPDLAEAWNMGPPSSAPDVRGKSDGEAVELMVEWFRNNFEDPAEETPWDEGAYVFIWGRPYDASGEISATFAGAASDAAIAAAVEEIESDGYEWAPAGHRLVPEISDDPIIRTKQRLANRIHNWCFETEPTADPTTAETAFSISDVVTLLRAHHQLRRGSS